MLEIWIPVVLLVVLYSILLYLHMQKAAKKYVLKNSVALKQISLLTDKYKFHNIPALYIHSKHQKNLPAFRKFDYDGELLSYLKSKELFFMEQIKKANENKIQFNEYLREFERICENEKTNWKSFRKESIEKELIEQAKMFATCSVKVKLENIYNSPKGQNSYYNSRIFGQEALIRGFSQIKNREVFLEEKKEERSKMNDSLRYDILKRDGFKCSICGASALDGIKLHVDHIRPISKGGKTTPDNLRTLCSRCNLGKRDKYDPNGRN